jgi:hypothetical protein
VHRVLEQFLLAQQRGAFVVIANEVPPVHCVLTAHVGQEASEPNGPPCPRQGAIAVFVEGCGYRCAHCRRFPLQQRKQLDMVECS